MLELVLQYLVPVVVAAAVTFGMKLLKTASDWVATRSDTVKRIILGAIALVATLLSRLIGIELPADLLGIDAATLGTLVSAAITALLSHFLHKGVKAVTA